MIDAADRHIRALALFRVPPAKIAGGLGKDWNARRVSQRMTRMRRRGDHLPKFRPGRQVTPYEFDRLVREAEKRGVPPGELAARLLEAITTDNLYSVILGDDGDIQRSLPSGAE